MIFIYLDPSIQIRYYDFENKISFLASIIDEIFSMKSSKRFRSILSHDGGSTFYAIERCFRGRPTDKEGIKRMEEKLCVEEI